MVATYVWVLPIIMMEFFASNLVVGILPTQQDDTYHDSAFVIVGVLASMKGLLCFVSAPFVCNLSDKYGFKNIFYICIGCSCAPYAAMVATNKLLLYQVLDSMSGFVYCTFPLGLTYISHCIKEDQHRATNAFSITMAFVGASMFSAPIAGSLLASAYGDRAVYAACCVVYVANLLYVNCVFTEPQDGEPLETPLLDDESASGENREEAPLSMRLPEGYLAFDFQELFSITTSIFHDSASLRYLGLVCFVNNMTEQMLVSLLLLYLKKHLDFTAYDSSELMMIIGAASSVALLVVMPLMLKYVRDLKVILRVGLLCNAASVTLYAAVDRKWEALAIPSLLILAFLVFPTIQGIAYYHEAAYSHAKIQGFISGFRFLAEGVSPLLFGMLFHIFDSTEEAGMPFLVAGMLVVSTLPLTRLIQGAPAAPNVPA